MVPVDTCWIYWGHLSWSRVSPGRASGKESSCQCRRFDPWVQKTHWRRKWQPTPVSLPEKFLRQRSLAGYSPSGGKESDMTQQLSTHLDLDVWTQVTSLHHSQVTLCPAHSHWHTHTHTHTHTFGLFFPLRDVCSETGSGLLLSLRVGPLAQVSAWVEIYFLNKWENDKMKRKTTEATLSDLGFLPKKL